MKTKNLFKIFIALAIFMLIGTIKVFAADSTSAQTDTVAPVFSPSNQTTYIIQGSKNGGILDSTTLLSNIKATDNVDGSNVKIDLSDPQIDLSSDGEYQLLCTATDKAGNSSYCVITVIVDGLAPKFADNTENLYYINHDGTIFNSKYEVVESLPATLTATDSLGAYSGIGVYITTDENGNVIFVGTLENSPAQSKLQDNDILTAINGEDVTGKSLNYVVSEIKGEEGTSVNLTVKRNGQEKTVTIQRELIKIFEDENLTATPDKTIDSIDISKSGTTEITYTATDEAGNKAEFVVKVIVIDEDTPNQFTQDVYAKENEELDNITTSGNPPENINIEIPLENSSKTNEVAENQTAKNEASKAETTNNTAANTEAENTVADEASNEVSTSNVNEVNE